jgi:hypothetical protein
LNRAITNLLILKRQRAIFRDPSEACMSSERSLHVILAKPACHPSEARMMVAKRPRHGGKAAMIQAKLGRHPGFAWMMVASRPRHGFAMMWASPTCHPGSARMIRAKLGCHGGKAAMINLVDFRNIQSFPPFLLLFFFNNKK